MSSLADKIQESIDIITEMILSGDTTTLWLVGTPYQCEVFKSSLTKYAQGQKIGLVASSLRIQISHVTIHQIHPAQFRAFTKVPFIDLRGLS